MRGFGKCRVMDLFNVDIWRFWCIICPETIQRSKFMQKKIKDAGISLTVAMAALAPVKSAAQNRTVDPKTQRVTLAYDTIRLGMAAENKSSAKKQIHIYNGGFGVLNENMDSAVCVKPMASPVPIVMMDNDKSPDNWRFTNAESDEKGVFYKVLSDAGLRHDGKYTYNTDAMYDKYMAIAKRVFKRVYDAKSVSIEVYCVGVLDQVVVYEDGVANDQTYIGTMILDAATGDILHHDDSKMSHKLSVAKKIPLVVYQLKNEGETLVHVYDARAGRDYIYKSTKERGVISSFLVPQQEGAK